jgi:predicted protein tyrosine phosphatase
LAKGSVDKEATVLVELLRDVEKLMLNIPDAFEYMNVTVLKKK